MPKKYFISIRNRLFGSGGGVNQTGCDGACTESRAYRYHWDGVGDYLEEINDPKPSGRYCLNRRDKVAEIPASQWDVDTFYDPDPESSGVHPLHTGMGDFLSVVDQFDPQFFGISPSETISMDLKQRLLLEVSWEALENAGIVQDRLAGSKTGVFIGISANEHFQLLMAPDNLNQIDTYHITGNTLNAAAGRYLHLSWIP